MQSVSETCRGQVRRKLRAGSRSQGEAGRGIKPATIGRRVAAIRYAHKLAGHDDPPTSSEVVRATVNGIRRNLGAAPVRKAPATADKVVAMAALADADLKGLRDRAILLLGFAGAFRRSELVAVDVGDLEFCESLVRAIWPASSPGGCQSRSSMK